eukprot:1161124-Pelagomonas_calceolata.AAC.11
MASLCGENNGVRLWRHCMVRTVVYGDGVTTAMASLCGKNDGGQLWRHCVLLASSKLAAFSLMKPGKVVPLALYRNQVKSPESNPSWPPCIRAEMSSGP